jgi:dipeptide/tripeptide permease
MSPSEGHPRGLRTLFFTEMWERFSYYGMRALLVLFLVDQTRGGFALSDATATAIYGLYTAAVYLAALPGGWAADRILGAQRAVWFGGILIACGHGIAEAKHKHDGGRIVSGRGGAQGRGVHHFLHGNQSGCGHRSAHL